MQQSNAENLSEDRSAEREQVRTDGIAQDIGFEKRSKILNLTYFWRLLDTLKWVCGILFVPAMVFGFALILKLWINDDDLSSFADGVVSSHKLIAAVQAVACVYCVYFVGRTLFALGAFQVYFLNSASFRKFMRPWAERKFLILAAYFLLSTVQTANLTAKVFDGIFAFTCITGALAIISMKNLIRDEVGFNAQGFLEFAASLFMKSQSVKAARPANLPRGITRGVLGVLCILVALVLPQPFKILLCFGGGMSLLKWARYYFQPNIGTLLQSDTRPPILFLRSFAEDKKLKKIQFSWQTGGTLEQRLANHFRSRGPFIALGDPAGTAVLGAARAAFNSSEWQSRVLEYMNQCSAIIFLAGTTSSIAWELRQIVQLGYVSKLIVLFRPTRTIFPWRAKRQAETVWAIIRETFAGTRWEPGLADLVNPRYIKSIVFKPSGQVAAVACRSGSKGSEYWAAIIAHYWQTPPLIPSDKKEGHPVLLAARFVGFVLDSTFLSGLCAPFMLVLWYRPVGLFSIISVIAFMCLPLIYRGICNRFLSATFGKAIIGLRVIMPEGWSVNTVRDALKDTLYRTLQGQPGLPESWPRPRIVKFQMRSATRLALLLTWFLVVFVGFGSAMYLYKTTPVWLFLAVPFKSLPVSLLTASSGGLRVGNVRFVDRESDPTFKIITYKPGEQITIRYDVIGYGRDARGKANLEMDESILYSGGTVINSTARSGFTQLIDIGDPIEVQFTFQLGKCTPSGRYQIRTEIRDVMKEAYLKFRIEFDVDPPSGAICHL